MREACVAGLDFCSLFVLNRLTAALSRSERMRAVQPIELLGAVWGWRSVVRASGVAAAVLGVGSACAQDVPPDPALLERLGIMTTQRGLDTANNPLDALVGRLAVACSTEPPLDTRPCPDEGRLLSFLRALPPDQDAIARILEALETTCRKEGARLDCFYERHVHHAGWAWGYDGPVASGDEIYRVTFTITKQGDTLQYGIDYHFLAVPK
jgi:hypothetical protein